jgi:hypothetical protein
MSQARAFPSGRSPFGCKAHGVSGLAGQAKRAPQRECQACRIKVLGLGRLCRSMIRSGACCRESIVAAARAIA